MNIIGVISESKKFDIFKKLLLENSNKNNCTIININKKSIRNLKNIKFDIIIFLSLYDNYVEDADYIKELCENIKYLVINSDIEIKESIFDNLKVNIITFGLNHMSTVTFSSFEDENVMISVQRDFYNIKKKKLEVGEYSMCVKKTYKQCLYEILSVFIISFLLNNL